MSHLQMTPPRSALHSPFTFDFRLPKAVTMPPLFPSAQDITPPPGGWPRISIVTPNYNYANTLETTVRSVIGQSYPELEHIVVDGNSTDESHQIIERYLKSIAHVVCEKDDGQYDAINKGLRLATGEIIGWLNSDDILFPWTLQAVGEIFASFPDVHWISARPTRITNGIPREVMPTRLYPQRLLQLGLFDGTDFSWVQQESTFWRRSLMEEAGLLDTSLRFAADFEWWTRFARHAELVSVDFPIGGFWDHGTNRSITNRDRYQAEVTQVLEKLDAQQRGERERILGHWRRFTRVKHLTGLRGVVRRLGPLKDLGVRVISWDNAARRYAIAPRPLLPIT